MKPFPTSGSDISARIPPKKSNQKRNASSVCLRRQWRIMHLLGKAGPRGRWISSIAAAMGVNKDVVDFDVNTLMKAGFPVVKKPDPTHKQRLIVLVEDEQMCAALSLMTRAWFT